MNRLMQWYLTRRALKLLRAGWEIGDSYRYLEQYNEYRKNRQEEKKRGGSNG